MTQHRKKLNILQVIDKFSMDGVNPSSCTGLLADWALRMDPDRFRNFLCGIKRPEPAGLWLEKKGMEVFFLSKGKYSPAAVPAMMRLIDAHRIDILHLHGYSSANFGRIAARLKGIPAVVHEHAIMDILPHQYLMDFALRGMTDAAVAVSEAVKRFMVRGRCVPPEKVTIIPNGINLSRFSPADPQAIMDKRKELKIPEGSPIVGVVTRFREEKGNRYFIECAPHVQKIFPDARFVIVGDGPLRGELESLSQHLGTSESVLFTGFVPDVPLMLSLFDIAVIPSLTEGCPLALMEAMAVGKTIVATRVGGIREIARDGYDALLVPPADPVQLADRIVHLLKHRDLTVQLAARAKETGKRYSVENNVRSLEAIYLDLIDHAPADRQ